MVLLPCSSCCCSVLTNTLPDSIEIQLSSSTPDAYGYLVATETSNGANALCGTYYHKWSDYNATHTLTQASGYNLVGDWLRIYTTINVGAGGAPLPTDNVLTISIVCPGLLRRVLEFGPAGAVRSQSTMASASWDANTYPNNTAGNPINCGRDQNGVFEYLFRPCFSAPFQWDDAIALLYYGFEFTAEEPCVFGQITRSTKYAGNASMAEQLARVYRRCRSTSLSTFTIDGGGVSEGSSSPCVNYPRSSRVSMNGNSSDWYGAADSFQLPMPVTFGLRERFPTLAARPRASSPLRPLSYTTVQMPEWHDTTPANTATALGDARFGVSFTIERIRLIFPGSYQDVQI